MAFSLTRMDVGPTGFTLIESPPRSMPTDSQIRNTNDPEYRAVEERTIPLITSVTPILFGEHRNL